MISFDFAFVVFLPFFLAADLGELRTPALAGFEAFFLAACCFVFPLDFFAGGVLAGDRELATRFLLEEEREEVEKSESTSIRSLGILTVR